jgi:hypothetical protein
MKEQDGAGARDRSDSAGGRRQRAESGSSRHSGSGDVSVVVAVSVVQTMQVSGDHVVGVLTVRHRFVTAARPVTVLRVMRAAGVLGRAPVWVGAVDRDRALDGLRSLHLVHMPIVQIADVVLVSEGRVATIRSVDVRVLLVDLALSHSRPS